MRYRVGLETRTRILEATRDLVAAQGLEKTTIKAICEKAGILVGSFYNLFQSKEEAILTVVADAIRAVGPDGEATSTNSSTPTWTSWRTRRQRRGCTSWWR
jgi:Transcriptional regulator